MNRRLKKFCLFWALALGMQLIIINVMFRGFAVYLRIEDWISYLFCTGYAIVNWIGIGWSGPVPISDSRWICGLLILLGSSIGASVQRDYKWNFVLNVLFVLSYLIGCVYSFINMAGAVT